MGMGRVLVFAGYFGLLGYTVAKTDLDKKTARAIKTGYTSLVKYTSDIAGPTQVHITLENIGNPVAIPVKETAGDSG